MFRPVFSTNFRDACRIVALQIYGRKGVWAYEAFDFINRHYFADRLPPAFIQWSLTPHGRCLGFTGIYTEEGHSPIITLHPALIKPTESLNPWGYDRAWLGPSLAFDVLLHECMHVHIECNLGGQKGRSSHDCKRWVRQVNRIAPPLGFDDVRAGGTRCVRVPDPRGERTPRGKLPTRVVRKSMGNIPMHVVATFPHSLREARGEADRHFGTGQLPDNAPRLDECGEA